MTVRTSSPGKAAKVARAKLLRESGDSFASIAAALGIHPDTAHMWVDPVYASVRRGQINRVRRAWTARVGPSFSHGVFDSSPSEAEIRQRRREIPEDTRSLTGRLMGDPLPGRSA